MERIVIENVGQPQPTTEPTTHKIDFQDCVAVFGILFLESGVGLLSVPAALCLAGVLCLLFAWLIERAKAAGKN